MAGTGEPQPEDIEVRFDHASRLNPAERERYLADLRKREPETASELESLLAFEPSAASELGRLVERAASHVAGGSVPVGQRIGQYLLIRHVGSGGMGSVYEAEDEHDRRRVALKITGGLGSAGWVAQLERERQILSNLDHPYIAKFLDGGTVDGRPYLVMEFVNGLPVTDYVTAHRLSIPDRIELFRKICAAVAYAHERLVVHRDLKPENILVTEDHTPRLLDFGVAKLVPGMDLTAPRTSMMVFGSLAYCSPEQAVGQGVSTRSDVYSLGVILFEMLTGKPARAFDEMTALQMRLAIGQTIELCAPELDRDLETIIRKATHQDAVQRYSSVTKLSEDLDRFVRALPIEARPPTWRYRASKFVSRNRAMVALSAALVVAVVAGGAALALEVNKAERRFTLARRLANVLLTDIHDKVNSMPGAVDLREKVAGTAVEYLDALSKEAGSDPELRLELAAGYMRLARTQHSDRSRTTPVKAIETTTRALHLLEGLPAAFQKRANAIEVDLRLARGWALFESVRTTESIADMRRARELLVCTAAALPSCERLLSALNSMAMQAPNSRDWKLASESLAEIRRIMDSEGRAWPEGIRLKWEVSLGSREMRIIGIRDRDHSAAARIGVGLLPIAARLEEISRDDVAALRALSFFYEAVANTLLREKRAGIEEIAPIAQRFWSLCERRRALDSSDVRAVLDLANAADMLGDVYQESDSRTSATWFDRAVELNLDVRRSGGSSVNADAALWIAGKGAILNWLRAGDTDKALSAARRVSAVIDPNFSVGLKLPRSGAAKELQASWWVASLAAEKTLPRAGNLWEDARRRAEAALAEGGNDPMTLAVCATIFDGPSAGSTYKEKAAKLWPMVAIAAPENNWVRQRLSANRAQP